MQKRSKATKMKILRHTVLSFILALGLMTIVGSGGGGDDGGGGGGGTTGLTYTGLTVPATLMDSNSELLLSGVVSGVNMASNMVGILGVVQDSGAEADNLSLLELTQLLEDALLHVDFNSGSTEVVQGVVESETIPGSCGGTFTYTITIDDVTGVFSGTMTFTSYCDGGATISGSLTISGTINLGTNEPENFLFSFNMLTVSGGGESAALDGTISVNATTGTITINLLMQENSIVFKYENTVLTESEGADGGGAYALSTVDGRFYHPDHGYVDITTITPFKVYMADENPSEGILLIEGAGNTKARLTAIDNISCRVEADTTGDDVWDYDSGPMAWTDL
jgi:hypothetical protein